MVGNEPHQTLRAQREEGLERLCEGGNNEPPSPLASPFALASPTGEGEGRQGRQGKRIE